MYFDDLTYRRTPLLRPQVGQRVRVHILRQVHALGTVRALGANYHEIELDPREGIPPSWLEKPILVGLHEVIELDPVEAHAEPAAL